MNWFTRLYLILWIGLIVVEIIAATTSYVPLDTMSEQYWWIQEKSPVLVRIILTVGMLVLWWHLVNKGQIRS
jgi:hypothetical protein